MAGLEVFLITVLAKPLGKFLLNNYLGEPAGDVGAGFLDVAKKKIESYTEQREAKRQFERLGERIAYRLLPLFERAKQRGELSVEAVGHELAKTLEGRISAEFFMTHDLDPAKLTIAFREARPFPKNQFSAAEIAFYDRALEEAVRYVVDVAAQLPRFEERNAAASLQRLRYLADGVDSILERTQRIEEGVAELVERGQTEEAKQKRYEADYRGAVIRNLDYVELFGADVRPEARRQALSVAYVSLSVKQRAKREGQAESLPANDVLNSLSPKAGRLLVRGEAGSGKSTLFRWIAIEAADSVRYPTLRLWNSTVTEAITEGRSWSGGAT